jgi:hypothetical protein
MLGWQHWITEIKHIREGVSFVDEQRHGPYASGTTTTKSASAIARLSCSTR